MLIAGAFLIMQIYMRSRHGTIGYKGHVVTYHTRILPRAVSNIPFLVFHAPSRDDMNKNFVIQTLIWPKPNNKLYESITIFCVEQAPADGYSDVSSSFIITDRTVCVYDWGLEENREDNFSV